TCNLCSNFFGLNWPYPDGLQNVYGRSYQQDNAYAREKRMGGEGFGFSRILLAAVQESYLIRSTDFTSNSSRLITRLEITLQMIATTMAQNPMTNAPCALGLMSAFA